MKAQFRRLVAAAFEYQVGRVIRRYRLKVVAVSGSVGKTSTKSHIAAILSQKYRVLVHHGNYNSEVGLPLSVFELAVPRYLFNPFAWAWLLLKSEWRLRHYPYQVLVLELGTDHPGDMAKFFTYLEPDVGVITAVTPEHMENFPGGIGQVAAEELTIAAACKQIIANADEIAPEHRRAYINGHPKHTYYGVHLDRGYSLKLHDVAPLTGSRIDIRRDGQVIEKDVTLRLLGETAAKAALAAYIVGEQLGLTHRQLTEGLATLRPVTGRLNPLPGLSGSMIIDDTYNSSPEAALAALQLVAALQPSGRRIAVMGSMNELGADSQVYHEAVGGAAAGLDWLVTVGQTANDWLGPAAVAAGLDPTRLRTTDSPYAAGRFLQPMLGEGDVVLVKGSQNRVFTEETTRLLLANPADASQLVRQSAAWQRVKRGQFPDA